MRCGGTDGILGGPNDAAQLQDRAAIDNRYWLRSILSSELTVPRFRGQRAGASSAACGRPLRLLGRHESTLPPG